jgi:hypothetical protein
VRKGEGVSVPIILVPREVADRCYLSEALLWAAFSRLPLKFLNGQPDSRDEGSDIAPFGQSPDTGPLVLEECNRAGLPPRPVWEGPYSYLEPDHLSRLIDSERSDEKRCKLQREYYEVEKFQERLSDWNRKFDEFTDQPRFKLLQALQEERLGATGKKFPLPTIEDSVRCMNEETPKHVRRDPIRPDFWSSATIDWLESFAEDSTEGRATAYGLILIEVAQLLKEFPLPNGEPYGGVSKAGGYLVLKSADEIRGGAKLGRPSYNWDDFHLEMAKRVIKASLPNKMDACVADLQIWCEGKWNRPVGRSTLKQKIKPYYDEFMRKSETQED